MERACIFKLYENQILNKNICIYMIYIYIYLFIFIYFQTTIIRGYKYYVPRNSDKYSVTVNVYIFILYISSEWAGLSLAPLILSHLRLSLTCA